MPLSQVTGDLTQSLSSPAVRVVLGAIGLFLLWVLVREVRRIPARLLVLMATAFVDRIGVSTSDRLLPFYVKRLGQGAGVVLGVHAAVGLISGVVVSAFT